MDDIEVKNKLKNILKSFSSAQKSKLIIFFKLSEKLTIFIDFFPQNYLQKELHFDSTLLKRVADAINLQKCSGVKLEECDKKIDTEKLVIIFAVYISHAKKKKKKRFNVLNFIQQISFFIS